ncbi:MAG: hypothetical protein LBI17_02905 [Rickettsiales bacterium]|jgi:hypothetical protein|nr:hypothetical protein [Rickettsiales bacterium]
MNIIYHGFGYRQKPDWKTLFWLKVLGLEHARPGDTCNASGKMKHEAALKLISYGIVREINSPAALADGHRRKKR